MLPLKYIPIQIPLTTFTAPSVVQANVIAHLDSCRVLKEGPFSSFASQQPEWFFKKYVSAHVTTMLKTQNIILHFSHSKALWKSYMTQTS